METSRESEYQSMLDYEAKKRYKEKLSTESEILPDRYSLFEEEWIDDITKWPHAPKRQVVYTVTIM